MAGLPNDSPLKPRAQALIAALERESSEFRAWWPAYELWVADGPVRHQHEDAALGRVELDVMLLDVRTAPGLTLITYVPCDSLSADRLRALVDVSRIAAPTLPVL